jgi:hypothetical protein
MATPVPPLREIGHQASTESSEWPTPQGDRNGILSGKFVLENVLHLDKQAQYDTMGTIIRTWIVEL